MKSKNLFHFTIVFFMAVAIVFFCVYEYVAAQPPGPWPSGALSDSEWWKSQRTYPGLKPINVSIDDLFTTYPVSVTIAPSMTQYQPLAISDLFKPDLSTMLLPEVSQWYLSPARLDMQQFFNTQAQLPSPTDDRFYNLTDFTRIDQGYDVYDWQRFVLPITRDWNVYTQRDFYALPGSAKQRLYEFTKELDVPMVRPDYWASFGGGYGGAAGGGM